jgi:hypothetical protein
LVGHQTPGHVQFRKGDSGFDTRLKNGVIFHVLARRQQRKTGIWDGWVEWLGFGRHVDGIDMLAQRVDI